MTKGVYYNEFEPYAAEWLRNLIFMGHIPAGDVDERSIKEVNPDDLKGYAQHHFFAGIAGWPRALRLAGWPDDKSVWTGSCPCQPFSTAGKQKGQADERHLWPVWFRLIAECRPDVVFGEQVANAIAHGWWDDVANDLERENYACGAAVLPACSIGAPHKRDRLWFVADSLKRQQQPRHENESFQQNREAWKISMWNSERTGERAMEYPESSGRRMGNAPDLRPADREIDSFIDAGENSGDGYVEHPAGAGSLSAAFAGIHSGEKGGGTWDVQSERSGGALENPQSLGRGERRTESAGEQRGSGASGAGGSRDVANAEGGHARRILRLFRKKECGPGRTLPSVSSGGSVMGQPIGARLQGHPGHEQNERERKTENGSSTPATPDFRNVEWILCPDGKTRPVEPSICLLAHAISARVGKLRALGNAIVPPLAAEFIKAYGEAL